MQVTAQNQHFTKTGVSISPQKQLPIPPLWQAIHTKHAHELPTKVITKCIITFVATSLMSLHQANQYLVEALHEAAKHINELGARLIK